MGSKFARFACGTNRSVLAAAPCEMAGVASPPVAAKAPAPAEAFKNVLRSMWQLSQLNSIRRPKLRQSATSFGGLHMPCEAEARAADIGALRCERSKAYATWPTAGAASSPAPGMYHGFLASSSPDN